jgi:hypothetical protein
MSDLQLFQLICQEKMAFLCERHGFTMTDILEGDGTYSTIIYTRDTTAVKFHFNARTLDVSAAFRLPTRIRGAGPSYQVDDWNGLYAFLKQRAPKTVLPKPPASKFWGIKAYLTEYFELFAMALPKYFVDIIGEPVEGA